jgi:hypothetical protein
VTAAKDYDFAALRNWVLARYRPADAATKDATAILLEIAQDDDEQAFNLFFAALDAALASHADDLKPGRTGWDGEPLAASGYLDILGERPAMFLRRVSVGCLRAFLDGYSLAAMEEGFFECADLEGFEHWVRRQFNLKGLFRWEDAVLAQFGGNEGIAFPWAVRELKAYRASKGPLSDRRYEVHSTSGGVDRTE